MGNIWDSVKRTTASTGVADRLTAFKAKEGKKATAKLAEKFGVHIRTAQKWVKEGKITKAEERESELNNFVKDDDVTSSALRDASVINFGHISVAYNGKNQGFRQVGTVVLAGTVKALVDQAAAAVEAGNSEAAEKLMGRAALTAYAESVGDSKKGLLNTLEVTDLGTNFSIG